MLILLQRVNHASVIIDGNTHAAIGKGLLAFVGLEAGDTITQASRLLDRVLAYRIFADEAGTISEVNQPADEADQASETGPVAEACKPARAGRMNRSLTDIDGELLLVSQFTLVADTNKGLRPGFSRGMAPAPARALYEELVSLARHKHPKSASGVFAADMKVTLENDGPVTFLLRS